MAVSIATGSKKCRVSHLLECPVCGDAFEVAEGRYVQSATLSNSLLVCCKHETKELTVEQEIAVQNALKAAIDSDDGYICVDSQVVKKAAILKKHMSSWVEQ